MKNGKKEKKESDEDTICDFKVNDCFLVAYHLGLKRQASMCCLIRNHKCLLTIIMLQFCHEIGQMG